jgi:hypothetical protein
MGWLKIVLLRKLKKDTVENNLHRNTNAVLEIFSSIPPEHLTSWIPPKKIVRVSQDFCNNWNHYNHDFFSLFR